MIFNKFLLKNKKKTNKIKIHKKNKMRPQGCVAQIDYLFTMYVKQFNFYRCWNTFLLLYAHIYIWIR